MHPGTEKLQMDSAGLRTAIIRNVKLTMSWLSLTEDLVPQLLACRKTGKASK
jgi:hypothetical protein